MLSYPAGWAISLAQPAGLVLEFNSASAYCGGVMWRWNKAVGAIVAASLSFVASTAAQSNTKASRLTIEQLGDIKHPSNPVWSPDGKHIVYVWDRAGVANLYLANADGHGQPQALTSFPEGQVDGAFWNEDSDTVYFPHGGDLWQVPVSGGSPKLVWSKPDRAGEFVPSPDARRVAFVRVNRAEGAGAQHGSDLIIRWLSDGREATTAHDDVSIRRVVWSPDGASLAYTAGSKTINHDETPAYSGEKIIYRIWEYVPGQIYAAKITGGEPVAIGAPGEYGGLAWVDATHLVYDGQSKDFKKYSIYVVDVALGNPHAIHDITEEQFWSIPDWGEAGAQPWPSPDGKWIAFLSDRDGWDHLYVVPSAGGDAVQLTALNERAGDRQQELIGDRQADDTEDLREEEHRGSELDEPGYEMVVHASSPWFLAIVAPSRAIHSPFEFRWRCTTRCRFMPRRSRSAAPVLNSRTGESRSAESRRMLWSDA